MLDLDVQFCNEEEGEWDFVGELGPDTKRTRYVLEVCLKFLLLCLLLTQGLQQTGRGRLVATGVDNRGRYLRKEATHLWMYPDPR